jgi:hypothetical protein
MLFESHPLSCRYDNAIPNNDIAALSISILV